MVLSEDDLMHQLANLSAHRLHHWIRQGLVKPERREGAAYYHEVDIARVRLLYELEYTAELDEETLPLVLALLDQIHGLRNELKSLALAVDEQPAHVRERIRSAYARIADG
jgi:chaperone modulatory protein CbpM